MTFADAMAYAERELDAAIDRYLALLAAQIRHDIDATGPEDDAAMDRPPDPGSPWARLTVEEVIMIEHMGLTTWRDQTLAAIRRSLGT